MSETKTHLRIPSRQCEVRFGVFKNGAGTRGRRDNKRIFVVARGEEAYIQRKIGDNKEVPQCIYTSK